MWQCAFVFPDPEESWTWATVPVVGLPSLVRVLLTLRRSGIQEAIFPRESQGLQSWLQSYQGQRALPRLTWLDHSRWPGVDACAPVLGVRGGVLFAPQLPRWFREALGSTSTGKASRTGETLPVLLAFTLQEIGGAASEMPPFELLAAHIKAPAMTIPPETFCHTVRELAQPGRDRVLLSLVGKPTDRWHVRWVRHWTFPVMRWLASSRLTPNHITWAGFLVALSACVLIAQGRYWLGIVGALLLYASWVLDCMDGTLARLTFAESPFGQKLDTILGHLTNLCIFSALIWAVYGKEPLWQAAGMAVCILGGIAIAYRVSEKEKTYRSRSGPSPHGWLRSLLDKINHRDYAVLVFFLAVVQGFAIFLWLSLVGVQIYWLLHLWLIRQHQRAGVHP